MPDSLGARLRQRREEHGIDLIAIAAQTKIKVSLLEGLERDDVSHWPSGIFRRAYIRAYAQAIGLDPDAAVREFLQVHSDRDEEVTTEAIASTLAGARSAAGPPTRLRFLVGSALGSLAKLRRSPAVDEPLPRTEQDVAPGHVTSGLHASADPLGETPIVAEPRVDAVPEPPPAPAAHETHDRPVAVEPPSSSPAVEPSAEHHDWMSFADLCTRLASVDAPHQVRPLLGDAATLLDASGLIVWIWDPTMEALMPALAHGYSDRVLAHLPGVGRDEDNATAAAFRTGGLCTFAGDPRTGGALTLPLTTPDGCAGVLAIEVPSGREENPAVRATATILAALLSQLVGHGRTPEVRPHTDLLPPHATQPGGQVLRAAGRR